MKVVLLALCLLACIASSATAFKILVFIPVFGISHVRFSGRLADTLAQAGHEVAVYQPVLDETIKTKGFLSPNITKYYTLPRNPGDYPTYNQDDAIKYLWEGLPLTALFAFGQFRKEFCAGIMNDKANLDAMKAENFDLVITEWFEPCGYGIIETLGIKKYVTTWSGGLNSNIAGVLGVKTHFSYDVGHQSTLTEKQNFVQRVKTMVDHIFGHLVIMPIIMGGVSDAIKEHYPAFDMNTAIAKSAFIFTNSEDHIDYTIPRTPKIIGIPNMDNEKPKALTGRYLEIVESPKTRGIVLFSFGSVLQACTMPAHVKKAFLEAFAEFPDVTFFWKYEKPEDGTAADIPNVFIDKWLPQRDLLYHPKILAFITHGGQNSLSEAGAAGVPLVSLPVFADQPRNTKLIEYRGLGLGLDHKTLTKNKVVAALKEVLNNKIYKEKAQLISRMIHARPLSTKESFIKHVEFAAEFGDTGTLSAEGANQNAIVFHSLDVIGFLVVVVILVLLLIKGILTAVIRTVKAKFFKSKKE